MNTPIASLMSRKGSSVHSVPAAASVAEAVRVMNQHKVGSVIILEGTRLTGIFTERDVLTRVVAAGRSPGDTKVSDVMTANPVTILPNATVGDVMTTITERRCRHLPVVDEAGAVVGFISIGDVLRWMVDSHQAEAEHLRQYVHGVHS
jgi:CBS domain-containing protein